MVKDLRSTAKNRIVRAPKKLRFLFSRPRYRYEPLPDAQSIRILELKPGQPSDRVNCRLLIANIISPPAYKAISYVWGDPTPAVEIKCSGGTLKITVNLDIVLRRLRGTANPRLLWADAICINQEDIQERNQQVNMMGLIYRSSECTLAWLGADEGHAEAAFSLVHSINDLIRGQSVYKVPAIQSSDPLLSDAAPWESLERLSKLHYFTRAWIQQEVGLAKKVVFHWGDHEILRDPLVRSILYVDRMIRAGDLKLNMSGTPLINTCMFFETASGIQDVVRDDSVSNRTPPKEELFLPNFWEVLRRASRLQASDPRDLVFAFLGHPTALDEGSPIIKVDYMKTVEEVYTQAAAAELVGRKNFHVLSMVSHESSLHGRLPSWVPDFSRGIGICYGMLWESAEYFCAIDVEAHLKANDPVKILKLRGIVMDYIVERTDVMRERDFQLNLETPRSDVDRHPWDWIQDLVRKVQASHIYHDKDMDIILSLLLVGGLVQLDWAEDKLDQHLANFFAYCANVPANFRSEAWKRLNWRADLSSGESLAVGDWKGFQGDHEYACVGRRAFHTKKGYLGLGPMATQPGDLVCVLFGAKVPFILRHEEDHYLLVGECYVHGIMRGEAVEMWRRGELEEVEFEMH